MKISLLTLGCKVNQAESSQIADQLVTSGCTVVGLDGNPDICIINTCSVTSKSDYQSRQLIRRAAKTGSKVVVTGCYSQIHQEMVRSMDGVTMIVPNDNKIHINKMLTYVSSRNTSVSGHNSMSRRLLKVQDGCDNTCSYCIIPMARGKSRSRKITEVIEEINSIADLYNEVVITGIHLGTYGYDLFPKVSLSVLIKNILRETHIKRIRLSSLEINEIDSQLIELLQEKRLCQHLHIPLQSADDKILGMMNRSYSLTQFQDILSSLYQKIPEISIGTDIIVGFPGEGEIEFKKTKNFLENSGLSYLHIFPFSARPGTKAFDMKSHNSPSIKKDRCNILRSIDERIKAEYMKKQMGRILDLLVETKNENGLCTGTTGNYLKVRAYLKTTRLKDIEYVRISDVNGDVLTGCPIEIS